MECTVALVKDLQAACRFSQPSLPRRTSELLSRSRVAPSTSKVPPSRRVALTPHAADSSHDDQLFGHRLQQQHPPARELKEEEKQKLVEKAEERIKRQTEQKSQRLRNEAHVAHLDHELKFGKMMFSQGNYDSALIHFERVVGGSAVDSYHRGEGTLQKAACLEKLGREGEAKALYESLVRFRAPYPNIKRRAAEALSGSAGEGGKAPEYQDYMYQMFLNSFGSYVPKVKYVETEEEKMVMKVLPWAILLVAPLLLVYLLFLKD